jgi:hypothetical protein
MVELSAQILLRAAAMEKTASGSSFIAIPTSSSA